MQFLNVSPNVSRKIYLGLYLVKELSEIYFVGDQGISKPHFNEVNIMVIPSIKSYSAEIDFSRQNLTSVDVSL